jgi:AraC-like DNA-binding protein
MSVLLDTRTLPAQERVGAFSSAFNAASKPTTVTVTPDVVGVLQAWELSPAVNVVQLDMHATELRVNRSTRHLRLADPERLSVAFNMAGTCLTNNLQRQESRNQVLRLTDLTSTYGIVQRGRCRAVAVEMNHADLWLSVDQVRSALEHATSSPLHPLVRRHLADVATSAEAVDPVTRLEVAAATVHLVRGMLSSVSDRDRHVRQAHAETLRLRIEDYVRTHLGDPALSPAQVAEAHHISLRHLYVVLADVGRTPAEWIIELRIEAARRTLGQPGASVADTARRWGFKDPSHFARRFKAAHGVTPHEYTLLLAAQAHEELDPGSAPEARRRPPRGHRTGRPFS